MAEDNILNENVQVNSDTPDIDSIDLDIDIEDVSLENEEVDDDTSDSNSNIETYDEELELEEDFFFEEEEKPKKKKRKKFSQSNQPLETTYTTQEGTSTPEPSVEVSSNNSYIEESTPNYDVLGESISSENIVQEAAVSSNEPINYGSSESIYNTPIEQPIYESPKETYNTYTHEESIETPISYASSSEKALGINEVSHISDNILSHIDLSVDVSTPESILESTKEPIIEDSKSAYEPFIENPSNEAKSTYETPKESSFIESNSNERVVYDTPSSTNESNNQIISQEPINNSVPNENTFTSSRSEDYGSSEPIYRTPSYEGPKENAFVEQSSNEFKRAYESAFAPKDSSSEITYKAISNEENKGSSFMENAYSNSNSSSFKETSQGENTYKPSMETILHGYRGSNSEGVTIIETPSYTNEKNHTSFEAAPDFSQKASVENTIYNYKEKFNYENPSNISSIKMEKNPSFEEIKTSHSDSTSQKQDSFVDKMHKVASEHMDKAIYNGGVTLETTTYKYGTSIPGKVLPTPMDNIPTTTPSFYSKEIPGSSSELHIKSGPPVAAPSSSLSALINKIREEERKEPDFNKTTTIDDKSSKKNAVLNNKNEVDMKTIDSKDEESKKSNEIKEEKIKALKKTMVLEYVGNFSSSIAERSISLVSRQVNGDAVEGYYDVKRKFDFAKTLLFGGSVRLDGIKELNRLRNMNSLSDYIANNSDMDLKNISSKDYKNILKKANKNDFSPLNNQDLDMEKIKKLHKSQIARLEQGRNLAASKGIIMNYYDNMSPAQKKLIDDKDINIFNYSSKKGVIANNNITMSLLAKNPYLKNYNFNKARTKNLKKLLDNDNLSTSDKILVNNLILNRKAMGAFDKINQEKGRVVRAIKDGLVGNLQNEESFQGFQTTKSALQNTKKLAKGSFAVARGSLKFSKGSIKVGYKVATSRPVKFVAKTVTKPLKYIGDKTGATKVIAKAGNVTKNVVTAPTKVAGKGLKAVGHGFKVIGESKPVQVIKKAGNITKKVVTAPARPIKKFVKWKARLSNKIANNKVVKFVTKPFKVANKVLSLGKVATATIKKYLMIGAGIFFIVFLLVGILTSMVIPAILGSVIADDEENIQAWVNELRTHQTAQDDEIINLVNGSPEGKDLEGNTISSYGMPETHGPNGEISYATEGYKIIYLDANGNEILKADNSKDILSFLAVYLQQDFDLGDGYVSGMIKELFDVTHPEIEKEESDIYTCDYGCKTITYHCNELPTYESYHTYGSRHYSYWGCDPYVEYCEENCTCLGHIGSCNDDCPPNCTSLHIEYCEENCTCPGHQKSRCEVDHELKICTGHRDVVVKSKILYLQDLLDMNYYLCQYKEGIHPFYNGKIDDLKEAFDEIGGWDETNREWAWNIYNQDWYDLYGISLSSFGLSLDTVMTRDDIDAKINELGNDISSQRKDFVKYAYRCVGLIPFYDNGRTDIAGIENNSFGSVTTPDYYGNNRVGLSSDGFIDFMFQTVLGVPFTPTNINASCTSVFASNLKPGDIAFSRTPGYPNNLAAIFAGYNEYGQQVWIFLSSTDKNVVTNNSNYWTCYYRPKAFVD